MKRMRLLLAVAGLALALGFGAGMSAAGKAYQFTGTVKSNDAGTLTVEKSAKETWTFSTDKDTKGTAKVGDKVTVYESNARPAFLNEVERPRGREGQIDDDAGGARAGRGTAILNPHLHGAAVRQIRHANQRSERIGGVSRHHRAIVESNAARRHLAVEIARVIRREPFADLQTTGGGRCPRCVRPRGAPPD